MCAHIIYLHTTFSPFAFPRNKVNPIYSNGNSPSRSIPFTNCIITPSACAFRQHVSARLPHNMTTSERPKHCTQVCNRSRTAAGVERDAPTSNRFPAFFFPSQENIFLLSRYRARFPTLDGAANQRARFSPRVPPSRWERVVLATNTNISLCTLEPCVGREQEEQISCWAAQSRGSRRGKIRGSVAQRGCAARRRQ